MDAMYFQTFETMMLHEETMLLTLDHRTDVNLINKKKIKQNLKSQTRNRVNTLKNGASENQVLNERLQKVNP